MIQENDLRIGNYAFTYKPEMFGIIKAISATRDGTVYLEVGFIKYPNLPCNQLEPIPLTPEILEKCGFEKLNSGNRRFNKIVLMCESVSNYLLKDIPLTPIRYLHQLQNLYFALTGEELEVKL